MNPGLPLDISDDYYFWHEGAYGNILSALVPFLHPWLGKHVCELIGGLDEMARGEMGICFRTRMSIEEFDGWFARCESETEEGKATMGAYLTRPVTRSMEIYCVEGAEWDQEYRNVLHRHGRRDWQQRCVRVEREKGLRMGDGVEELRSVLNTSKAGADTVEAIQRDVMLEWRFGEAASRMTCFEWFDGTG